MNNHNLVLTLGIGSLAAFLIFYIFYKLLHWTGKMAALATAASMLLLYIPNAVLHWPGLDEFAIHFAFFMMIPYGLGIITGVHSERRKTEGKDELEKGLHWIPGMIIVFFILLAVVDSIIITFATKGVEGAIGQIVLPKSVSGDSGAGRQSRFTGNVPYDFQNKEDQFDGYVLEIKKQKQLGWKISGGWENGVVANQDSVFAIHVMDKAGAPIRDAKVILDFIRASSMYDDLEFELKENKPGFYGANINLSLSGCWQMRILVTKGDNRYEIRGNSEVAELVDGKLVAYECAEGAPEMDTAK